MASYSWIIEPIEQLASDQREHAANLPALADEVLYEWAQETRAFLKGRGYPSAPGGSKYVRTGLLANKWAAQREGRGIVRILNEAATKNRYAGYVIGDSEDQARMHEGRWWQATEEIASRYPALDQKMDARLGKDLD
jgi:hypothetical protein